MDITAKSATLGARDVAFGGELTVEHLKLESPALRLTTPIGSGPCAAEITVSLTLSETDLNRALARHQEAGMRDVQVALMNGHLRVTGKYEVMGPFAVPFALAATPEIEGGARLRLQVRDVSIVGAALPGFSAQVIGERVNAKLREALNVQRLGLPIRLSSITVETGRLTVTAQAAVEWRPGDTGVVRTEE